MMAQQPRFQLPNPAEIFADPRYNGNAPRVSQKEIEDLMNRRGDFAPPQVQQQVQKFDDINNAKTFQIQSLHNDLVSLKAKLAEVEKRLYNIEQPGGQAPQVPMTQVPTTHYQPLQSQVQSGFQPQQQQHPQMQNGFQPQQQPQMQNGFQPQQQPQMHKQQVQMQQVQMQQPPQMQGGFQPYRAQAPPPSFR